MDFRTIVNIPSPDFQIEPLEPILFVGSCFADKIGCRFEEERFPVTVNPFGVMYNPASVLHTIQRCEIAPRIAFLTLGTNHIYRLKETGEIVDNCQKRPQNLFQEEELSVSQCVDYLSLAADELRDYRFYQPDMLHPSDQAVEYIWQQFVEAYFSPRAKQFLQEWKPIKEALGHRPFHPESDTYRQFIEKARQQEQDLLARYQSKQ